MVKTKFIMILIVITVFTSILTGCKKNVYFNDTNVDKESVLITLDETSISDNNNNNNNNNKLTKKERGDNLMRKENNLIKPPIPKKILKGAKL